MREIRSVPLLLIALLAGTPAVAQGVTHRISGPVGAATVVSETPAGPRAGSPVRATAPGGGGAAVRWTITEPLATLGRDGIAVSGDGGSVVVGFWLNDPYVAHLDAAGSGVPIWTFDLDPANGSDACVGVSATGSVIAGTSDADPLYQWGPSSGTPTQTHPHTGTYRGAHAAVDRAGTFVASISVDANVPNTAALEVYEATGALRFRDANVLSLTSGLDVAAGGSRIVANESNRVRVWDAGSGTQVMSQLLPGVLDSRLSGDGNALVFGNMAGEVNLYRWNGSQFVSDWVVPTGRDWVVSVAISDDASTVMAGTLDIATPYQGDVQMIDALSGGVLWTDPGYGDEVAAVDLSADGSRGVAASWGRVGGTAGNLVAAYDRGSNVPIFAIADDALAGVGSAFAASISSAGDHVAVGGKAVHARENGNGGWAMSIDLDAGCPAIALSPTTLPDGNVGAPYNQAVVASGGTAPYVYAIVAGVLPAGLSLAPATGVISGTPASAGTASFTVEATDAAGCAGSRAYDLTVLPCSAPLSVSPAALPPATVGLPYAATFTASGGTPPYTFSVAAGTLPPGLVLAASGALSGTPTAPGSFPFTVEATDASGCQGSVSPTLDVREICDVLAGTGLGPPNANQVRAFDNGFGPTGVDFLAYAAGQWGTNVAGGKLTGGIFGEILTGPGPGDVFGPHTRGFSRAGTSIAKINFFAYGTLRFGVNVASGDSEGDGFAEIFTGAGPGAVFGPHVRGWNYDATAVAPIGGVSFYAYQTLRYGVNVEEGDLDADALAELVTGAGPGVVFAPTVRAFQHDGQPVASIQKVNFNAFSGLFGVNVSSADVDRDPWAEIVTARGPDPLNASELAGFDYDGAAVAALPGYAVSTFPATRFGARCGLCDLDLDGSGELLAGAGRDPAASSTVEAYGYDVAGQQLVRLVSYVLFQGTGNDAYGVNVVGASLGY